MGRDDRVVLAQQLLESFKPIMVPSDILLQHGIATLALYDYFTLGRVNYDIVAENLHEVSGSYFPTL